MKIQSTAEALTFLYSLPLNDSNLRFRGHADFDWALQPSVYRFEQLLRYQTVDYESNVLQAKPSEPQPPLTHTTYQLEWLMLCQHYGIPTRLLDWSTDILVSLFFACDDKALLNTDGALFVCNQGDYPLFAAYDERAITTQELAMVSTNVVNPRMRTQSGCFMMWGHAPLFDNSTETYDLWEYTQAKGGSHFLKKICIPGAAKRPILDELKSIYSITKDSVYLRDGYLEKKYALNFKQLKEMARLMTLYKTDADRLTQIEEERARSLFNIDCRNMLRNTVNLRKI